MRLNNSRRNVSGINQTGGRLDRGSSAPVMGDSGVPAGQIAGRDALAGTVIRVPLDGGLVILLPQDLVVLVNEKQFADDEEEHLAVLDTLGRVPGAGDLVNGVARTRGPVVLLIPPRPA